MALVLVVQIEIFECYAMFHEVRYILTYTFVEKCINGNFDLREYDQFDNHYFKGYNQ
jgi:hypothetical protein